MSQPFKITIEQRHKDEFPELECFVLGDKILVTVCSYEPVQPVEDIVPDVPPGVEYDKVSALDDTTGPGGTDPNKPHGKLP